ncbi:unnamed protein product [Lepidochelys kempii]
MVTALPVSQETLCPAELRQDLTAHENPTPIREYGEETVREQSYVTREKE